MHSPQEWSLTETEFFYIELTQYLACEEPGKGRLCLKHGEIESLLESMGDVNRSWHRGPRRFSFAKVEPIQDQGCVPELLVFAGGANQFLARMLLQKKMLQG